MQSGRHVSGLPHHRSWSAGSGRCCWFVTSPAGRSRFLRARALARRDQPADAVAAVAGAGVGRHRRAAHLPRGAAARRVLADAEGHRPAADHRGMRSYGRRWLCEEVSRSPVERAGRRTRRVAATRRCAGRIRSARGRNAPHADLERSTPRCTRSRPMPRRRLRRPSRRATRCRSRSSRRAWGNAVAASTTGSRRPVTSSSATGKGSPAWGPLPTRSPRCPHWADSTSTSTPTRRSAAQRATTAQDALRCFVAPPVRRGLPTSSSSPDRFEPAYRELDKLTATERSEFALTALLRGIGCESESIERRRGHAARPARSARGAAARSAVARVAASRRWWWRWRHRTRVPARSRRRSSAVARSAVCAAAVCARGRAHAPRMDPRAARRVAGAADPRRRARRRRRDRAGGAGAGAARVRRPRLRAGGPSRASSRGRSSASSWAASATTRSAACSDHLLALRALLEPEGPRSGRLAGRVAALCATEPERGAATERVAHAISLEQTVIAGMPVGEDAAAARGRDRGASARAAAGRDLRSSATRARRARRLAAVHEQGQAEPAGEVRRRALACGRRWPTNLFDSLEDYCATEGATLAARRRRLAQRTSATRAQPVEVVDLVPGSGTATGSTPSAPRRRSSEAASAAAIAASCATLSATRPARRSPRSGSSVPGSTSPRVPRARG